MSLVDYIISNKKDGLFYLADKFLGEAGSDVFLKKDAIRRIAEYIAYIDDEFIRETYIEHIANNKAPHRIKPMQLGNLVKAIVAERKEEEDDEDEASSYFDRLPKYMSRDEIEKYGFSTVKSEKIVGYYGWSKKGKEKISNFIIKPIFHVYGKSDDSRHIFEVTNDRFSVVMDVPSKVMVSLDVLQVHLVAEGNFIFHGNKVQLLRISERLLPDFPFCHELVQYGWQKEGFFANVGHVIVPKRRDEKIDKLEYGVKKMNSWGIVEILGTNYLSPPVSSVYSRERKDDFKMVRVLEYRESDINFETWAGKLFRVYGYDGIVGIAYNLICLFRDVVFGIDNTFPHLYAYGETSSGKSKYAESLTALFYNNRKAFNLNSGTDYAFFAYMQQFRNCLSHLNEFDDKVVREEWFQAIKGIFDGEGRMRGKMGQKNRFEIQEVESGLVLTGQYVSTRDDNAVVNRSIMLAFHERKFTAEDKEAYDDLKKHEEKGLSSILEEILDLRMDIEEHYQVVYNATLSNWRRDTADEFHQRIFGNWAHLVTIWKMFSDRFEMPISSKKMNEFAYQSAIDMSKFVRTTDTLTEFWNTVEFLLDQKLILEGWDFKIVEVSELKIRRGDGSEFTEQWGKPRKVLFLRLNVVHKLYQKAYRERTGKEAMNMENIKHYFSNRPYFIGNTKGTRFSRYVYKTVEKKNSGLVDSFTASNEQIKENRSTSAFAFDYNGLGCDLERKGDVEELPFG